MNFFATLMGWPIAADSKRASLSTFASRREANFSIMAARLWPAVSRHDGKAFFAAATAESMSFSLATWTLSVTRESSEGEFMERVSPVEEGTYWEV